MTAVQRVELRDLRFAGGAMLAIGAVRGVMHSSVGLPCPLRTLTGIPCPLCGMTTSVSAAASGHVATAFFANPAGLVAVAVALALIAFPRRESIDLPRWVLPGALAVMWVWELFRFGIL
jgi:uncharacterized protein DUF2752